MATSFKPIKGRAYKFYVGLVSQADTKLLQANPTIAAGDFQISKDGGAFANLTTLPSANPASGRAVMIDLSIAEMTADNIVVQCVDAAGAEWCAQMIAFETKDPAFTNFEFVMRDTAGLPATGKTVTATRSIDGGAFGAGTLGSVTEIANGAYKLAIPLADATYTDSLTLNFTASGCMATIVTLTPAF